MVIHVAVDANILANWILHDSFLKREQTERTDPYLNRIENTQTAHEVVTYLLDHAEYTLISTPLILAETIQVIRRERLLIHAYKRGIPFREMCRTRGGQRAIPQKEKEEMMFFLNEYVNLLIKNGTRILSLTPSVPLLLHLILQKEIETHDAVIIASLVNDPDLSLIITQDKELQKRVRRLVFTSEKKEEDSISLMSSKQFKEEIIRQGRRIKKRKRRIV